MTHTSSAEEAVMAAVAYADFFSFPLRATEVPQYLPFLKLDALSTSQALERLCQTGRLACEEGYYFLHDRRAIIANRLAGKQFLEEAWSITRRRLPNLLRFKFVKAALLSGSLAAGNPTKDADVDLFLILDAKRMWVGFLLMRLLARGVREIEVCPNYVVSDRSLELLFHNLFTAVELGLAVPLKSGKTLQAFEKANLWAQSFLPNGAQLSDRTLDLDLSPRWWSTLIDVLVASPLGYLVDFLEERRLRWRTEGRYQPKDKVYKPHPPTYQIRILQGLLERVNRYQIQLPQLSDHIQQQLDALQHAAYAWKEPVRKEIAEEYALQREG